MEIREATAADWPAIWPFFHEIVTAGETYAYDPKLTEPEARDLWMMEPPDRTVVAVDDDGTVLGRILGSAKIGRNQRGPGAHVATASFMVDPKSSGHGVGRALGEYAVNWARAAGFRTMQFNAVVETNTRAVKLWQALGFQVMTTLPEAFHHPTLGYVGLHVMYQKL